MGDTARQRLILGILMLLAAVVFLSGIGWGLPSRAVDRFLFGDEPVWSGEKIAALAPKEDDARGADVDANPLADRSVEIILNETDAQKAEIIRRYRLFSYQPDEMITFKSLSRLKENRGDPRLYQYGGLWVYPVGVLLKAASIVGYVDLKSGQAFYLDHPEAFGRFYVVARLYSAVWGVAGVWAVFAVTRRLSGNGDVALAAAAGYIFLPVVMNTAHEAKPHLAGAVLMLLAISAAMKYVDRGPMKFAILAGGLCGAATGMVVSSLPIFVILPVMCWLRRKADAGVEDRRPSYYLAVLAVAGVCGGAVYCLTNPFVPYNFVFNPGVLASNLGNSTAMYSIGRWPAGIARAAELMTFAVPLAVVIAGTTAAVVFQVSSKQKTGWLLAAPALLVFVQFTSLAAGKPGEYARFAVLPGVALLVAMFAVLARSSQPRKSVAVAAGLCVAFLSVGGLFYMNGFVRDAGATTRRLAQAESIDYNRVPGRADRIAVLKEIAPYNCPPVNLFGWTIVLVPEETAERQLAAGDLLIVPRMLFPALSPKTPRLPMSWADDAVEVRYDLQR